LIETITLLGERGKSQRTRRRATEKTEDQWERGAAPTAAVSAVRNAMDARITPSTAIAAHNAIAMNRFLTSMIKPALVGRRHDDASPHPRESVSNINIREGAHFRECHSEAMIAPGIGPVEQARVQEA